MRNCQIWCVYKKHYQISLHRKNNTYKKFSWNQKEEIVVNKINYNNNSNKGDVDNEQERRNGRYKEDGEK